MSVMTSVEKQEMLSVRDLVAERDLTPATSI